MEVEELPDGSWAVLAPWLDEPVIAPTFEEAYWLARSRHPSAG